MQNRTNYTAAFVAVTGLFFMWGFITCMNDILIPFVKNVFELNRAQSMLVQFYFFGGYFIGSLIYFAFSYFRGDPIQKIGYKNGILLGLIISAFGCALLFPAAASRAYSFYLVALFVVALGFTLLQISANPYVAILGRPENASSRLNFAQAFNSFGTTIAPVIGGYFVFHYFSDWGEPLLNSLGEVIKTEGGNPVTLSSIQIPYLLFAFIFLLLAVIIKVTKLPVFTGGEIEKGAKALRYRHLVLGMIAIFMYVGAEVSIGSVFINFSNELVGFKEMTAKSFLAFYWGGAMIGRFLGAVYLGDGGKQTTKILQMIGLAVLAFFLIYGIVYFESQEAFPLQRVLPFVIFMVLNFAGFIIGKSLPHRTLMVFALIIIVLLTIAMLTSGMATIWCIVGIGLFNSIMWSNIFTLAISGLGRYTSQGSSFLVMMVLGGAIIPFVQGNVADAIHGYHYSLFVPMISYIYLAFYGWKGYKPKSISTE